MLFGALAPVIKRASTQAGIFAAGALLYLGVGLASLAWLALVRWGVEAPLRRR